MTSASQELIRRLEIVSKALKAAAKWNGSDLAVDLAAANGNFLYELHCYFSCAVDASHYFTISISGKMEGIGIQRKANWPRSHGKKESFSHIVLADSRTGDSLFQLCPGIRITDKFGKNRAPDISLLRAAASDNPTINDVHGVWDAKYTIKPSGRLSDVAVSDFIYTFEVLGRPTLPSEWKTATRTTPHNTFSPWLRSGLITNGQYSTEPAAALDHYGIGETSGFPVLPNHRP